MQWTLSRESSVPEWSQHVRSHLASLRLDPRREAEIVDELSQHLDQRYEELRAGGITEAEARRLVIEELPEPGVLAEQLRPLRQAHVPPPIMPSASGGQLLNGLWRDLRIALRSLRQTPWFAAAAIFTFALA